MAKKGIFLYEWPRPMVTVDAVVFKKSKTGLEVLLIQRGKEPFKGCWALPGGFIEMDEELEDAAARELAEETGLKGVKLKQIHTFGTVGRDPRGRQISVVYAGILKNDKAKIKAGDDAAETKWFVTTKPPKKIGFDHRQIIRLAAKHYINKKA